MEVVLRRLVRGTLPKWGWRGEDLRSLGFGETQHFRHKLAVLDYSTADFDQVEAGGFGQHCGRYLPSFDWRFDQIWPGVNSVKFQTAWGPVRSPNVALNRPSWGDFESCSPLRSSFLGNLMAIWSGETITTPEL